MRSRKIKYFLPFILSGLFILLLTIFNSWLYRGEDSRGNLKEIRRNKVLRVITRNANTTYYYDRDGHTGFEYDLISEFAVWLGVDVEFIVENNVSAILDRMRKGDADIAAAGLTRTAAREQFLNFGPDYFSTHQVLVVHRDSLHINTPREMQNHRIIVPGGASYLETLIELQRYYPDLKYDVSEELSSEEILELVANGTYDCTVVDDNIFKINQRFLPEIRSSLDLTTDEYFAWVVGRDGTALKQKIYEWFEEFKNSGAYDRIYHRYYNHTEDFDYVDVRTFHKRVKTILPLYRRLFMEAAEQYGLEWTLLAALSYQESHWQRYAKSRTGVRGLMMLTRNTAEELNIENRLDVEESILGGSRYLRMLLERIPESVGKEDRISYALAAYNVGMGHLRDAMYLADSLGRDQDSWVSLRSVLPLLSQKKYYSRLKYGYARGSEPVVYVDRILNYKQILDNLNGEIP